MVKQKKEVYSFKYCNAIVMPIVHVSVGVDNDIVSVLLWNRGEDGRE